VRLIACGKIIKPNATVSKWLKHPRRIVCSYSTGAERYFARLATGGFVGHFHLEVVSQKMISRPPKALLRPRKQFDALTSTVIGQETIVRVTCFFVAPLDSLSPTAVIRTLSEEKTVAGVSMKLTSGKLALAGSAIDEIEWELQENESDIRIGIGALRRAIIAEDYLEEMLRWMRSFFETLIITQEVQTTTDAS
jgi:hypothetical protein